jgi:glycosyltransferase involved in cell wall biosynthesis
MSYKVLYISDCYLYGGSERSIINLINFISENPENEIFFGYRYYKTYQQGVDRDLSSKATQIPLRLLSNSTLFFNINKRISSIYIRRLIKLPFWIIQKTGIHNIFNYVKLRFIISRIKPDIIHINNGGYPASSICLNAVFAAKHCGLNRIVFHINNPAEKPSNSIQRFIDSKISEYTKIFVSGSNQTKKSLQKNRGFSHDKLLQIYNTIEQPTINNKREEVLEKYNIDNNAFIITEVAFLSQRKGQIFLLEAILKIKEHQPDIYKNIVVFLVGDGEDHQYLLTFCKKNKLSNVILTGYLPNFADYINASDLFILPSIGGEDMPLVVLVAMALRKAIISTRIAGIMEEIENGVSGILLETTELEFLDEHIIKLYHDKNLREFYAENAQERYNDIFLREKICNQFKLLYEKLLTDKL